MYCRTSTLLYVNIYYVDLYVYGIGDIYTKALPLSLSKMIAD